MLKQLYELAERLLTVTRDIRDNQSKIKKLESQVERLSETVRELAFEFRRMRERLRCRLFPSRRPTRISRAPEGDRTPAVYGDAKSSAASTY